MHKIKIIFILKEKLYIFLMEYLIIEIYESEKILKYYNEIMQKMKIIYIIKINDF